MPGPAEFRKAGHRENGRCFSRPLLGGIVVKGGQNREAEALKAGVAHQGCPKFSGTHKNHRLQAIQPQGRFYVLDEALPKVAHPGPPLAADGRQILADGHFPIAQCPCDGGR